MESTVSEALDGFVARFLAAAENLPGGMPVKPHEPDWPSPCTHGEPDGEGRIHWRPHRQTTRADLSGLSRALEVEIHPDLEAFFGTYWSEALNAKYDGELLDLIQLWNERDAQRLIENQLAHALVKQRVKAPLTFFFATVDDPEMLLTMDNQSGAVVLERVGGEVLREVELNLARFISRLEPDVQRCLTSV